MFWWNRPPPELIDSALPSVRLSTSDQGLSQMAHTSLRNTEANGLALVQGTGFKVYR